MHKSLTLAMVFSVLLFLPSIQAQAQIYKYKINGTTAYQSQPCPSGTPAKRPTIEQLNTDRQKSPEQSGAPAAGLSSDAIISRSIDTRQTGPVVKNPATP